MSKNGDLISDKIESLQDLMIHQEVIIACFKKGNENLAKENKKLKNSIENPAKESGQGKNKFDTLKEKNKKLEMRIKILCNSIAHNKARIETLAGRVLRSDFENEKLKKRINELKNELSRVQ